MTTSAICKTFGEQGLRGHTPYCALHVKLNIEFINLNLQVYAIRFYTSSPLDCLKYVRFSVKGHSPEWNVLDRDHYLTALYAPVIVRIEVQ
ncbi:hypothetical protein DBV15_05185 [Temnothorax longispinosus]|uniref:Uncharacterized protein n=1 Tax=Temnothorax longispinosus TaxID=300112 RepID=A0A4S2KX89_9HYME|nr:hypothetical protein DBV15_05185 [Temnothorax longispinosus]